MPTVVELPDGATATLRDSEELTNRQVKQLRRAARRVGLVGQKLQDLGIDELRATDDADTPDETPADDDAAKDRNRRALAIMSELSDDDDDALDLFQREAAVVRLVEWSLERPLPQSADEIDDLPRPIYAALTKAAAELDLNEEFGPDGGADPKATPGTDASGDSAPPSAEQPS